MRLLRLGITAPNTLLKQEGLQLAETSFRDIPFLDSNSQNHEHLRQLEWLKGLGNIMGHPDFKIMSMWLSLVFICSLHSSPALRWFHSCLWWLGCLERGFVRASGGWFRVVVGSVCFSLFCWFGVVVVGSLLGCGFLAVVCCGGSLLLPSAHALSTSGQFMDKVMIVQHQVAGIFCRQEIKFAPKIEETPSGHARARDNSQAHSWLRTRPAREKPSKTVSKIVLIGDLQTSQQSYSRN